MVMLACSVCLCISAVVSCIHVCTDVCECVLKVALLSHQLNVINALTPKTTLILKMRNFMTSYHNVM